MLGLSNYAEVVPSLFAWADVGVHEETYDDAEHDAYEEECVYYDSEGDRITRETFDDGVAGIRCRVCDRIATEPAKLTSGAWNSSSTT